ncbi:cytochrome c oxidase assembly protein [Pseudomonas luteola]|uniref:cytochrome c oxidase assembly protein n=1 Tax=Pseudomonas luteola TaxID=47886 RepID=UPI000F76F348|nr:cytochrome c oxidase assembly protein [Pseudomonas luteola]RRW42755.1 cytochrome c oxidase assembly protein [Pseudomonas luteola]
MHAYFLGPGHVAVFPILLAIIVWLFYCFGVICLQRQGRTWSGWRTLSFAVGIVLIVVAFMPPVSSFAHQDLRGHMLQHLLLGMFAPLGLVFGAPGTLVLRTIPIDTARVLVRLLATRFMRVLTHPITAALLDIGGMYVLYLTSFFALSQSSPWVHTWLHLHFILSGYLFTWAIAGPDSAPHRPALRLRLVVLFIAMAAHAGLAKIMYGFGYPHGLGYARTEIESAAQWMYYGGDLAEVLLAVAFCRMWFRHRKRLQAQAYSHQPLVYGLTRTG